MSARLMWGFDLPACWLQAYFVVFSALLHKACHKKQEIWRVF